MFIKNKYSRIFTSLAALLLIFSLAVGFTFSWSEGGNKGFVNGNDITISSGSNLTMRQDDKITNAIILPACNLAETSSKDGRNFFFPMGDNNSNITDDMKFREGTVADVNTKYISVDFELEAGDKAVDVYLGSGTIIQCDSKELLDALRIAFFYNDGTGPANNGTEPLIFKPNQMPGVEMDYSPISTIAPVSGSPTTTTVVSEAFGTYYYKGDDKSTPLFHLDKNECIHISLAIWLEGTEFSTADIAGENLDIYIDFSTSVDDLIKYVFEDNCHNRNGYRTDDNGNLVTDSNGNYIYTNHWVDDEQGVDTNNDGKVDDKDTFYGTMMYIFDVNAKRYYALDSQGKGSNTWIGYVPKTINNFYFRRYSIDIDMWWNEWEPDMGNIPTIDNTRTFVAIAGQERSTGTELDGCYGYWKDANDTIRIYFQMECAWNDPHCYAWDSSGEEPLGTWPGSTMVHFTDINGYPVYYVDIPNGSKLHGVIFNNGNEKSIVYFERDYGYDKNFVHVWDASITSTTWPGQKTTWDASMGTNGMNLFYVLGTPGEEFGIQHNQGNNTYQVNANNRGVIGKSYIFKEDDNKNGWLEEIKLEYKITDTQCFFNGSMFIYKNDTYKSMKVYTDEEESLIYPVNDPT